MRPPKILCIVIVLAAALAACRSPVHSDRESSYSLSFKIVMPPSWNASAPALKCSAARLVRPDTASVSVIVTGVGMETVQAESEVDAGTGSASVQVDGVTIGSGRTVSVVCYSAAGTVLGAGSAVFDLPSGGAASVSVNVAPLSTGSLIPGPYSAGVRGAAVSDAAGSALVYAVELPKGGAYAAQAIFSGYTVTPSAYGPDGAPLSMESIAVSGSPAAAFTAPEAGTYYVLVSVPAGCAEAGTVAVDADYRISASFKTVVLRDGTVYIDPMRPFVLSAECGFKDTSVAICGIDVSASFSNADLIVDPHHGSTSAFVTTQTPAVPDFYFADALLQIERYAFLDDTTSVFMDFTYVSSEGADSNSGLYGYPVKTLGAGLAKSASDYRVVAMLAGDSIAETAVTNFTSTNPVRIVGGCGADWTKRASSRSTTTVGLFMPTASDDTACTIDDGNGTYLQDLEFDSASASTNTTTLLSFVGPTKLVGCSVIDSGKTVKGELTFVKSLSDLYLEDCAILGGRNDFTAGSGVATVQGINTGDFDAQSLTLVNTVVDLGDSSFLGADIDCLCCRGVVIGNLVQANIESSTVSTGTIAFQNGTAASLSHDTEALYCNYGLSYSLYAANSIFYADDSWTASYGGNYAGVISIYGTLSAASRFNNCVFSNETDQAHSGVLIEDPYDFLAGAASQLSSVSYVAGRNKLGFASFTSALPRDFHLTGAASAIQTFERAGGLDLSLAANQASSVLGFTPTDAQKAALARDLSGAARSAGYSLGAYEY